MPRLASLTNSGLTGVKLKFGATLPTLKILLVSSDSQSWVNTVKTAMTAAASSYSYNFNITATGGVAAVPTLSVGQYDVVWFWGDTTLAWNSSLVTVNNAGTGLITSLFFPSVSGVTQGVMPVNSPNLDQPFASTTWPSGNSHPISVGNGAANQSVYPFSYTGYISNTVILESGASTVVSSPVPTYPLVSVKDNTAPVGRTVYLNMWPVSNVAYVDGYDYATQGTAAGRLFINACLWASRKI